MSILVTGAAGFLGPHVKRALLELDPEVDLLLFDRNDVEGGIRGDCKSLLGHHIENAHAIVHLAGHVDVDSRYWTAPPSGVGEEPHASLFKDNLEALFALLKAAGYASEASGNMKRFVFVSTTDVYNSLLHRDGLPTYDEADACVPQTFHAATKLAGEALVEAYAKRFDWEWRIARLVPCVGKGQRRGHIIDLVKRLREDKPRLRNQAAPPERDEREVERVHVDDAADALAVLATREDVPSGVYNVTSGQRWGLHDTGALMKVVTTPNETGGERVASSRLAPFWQPKRSVEDGVKEVLAQVRWEPIAAEGQAVAP